VRPLRVVTFNLWNDRPDVRKRMRVAVDAIRALQPDLIGLQEVVGTNSDDCQAAEIARALDAHWIFDPVHPRTLEGTLPGTMLLGNAVVSRFPVLKHDSLALPSSTDDPRRALYCAVQTPEGVLPFFTIHASWEMWLSPRREAQVVALDEFVHARPGSLPAVVTGDFNASPDTAAIRFLTGRTSLLGRGTYYRDCWARRHPHEDGHTWSDANPYAVRWIERNRRLDYIFVGPIRSDGWGAVLDCRVVMDLPGPDGVFASDHFGVYAEIGTAPAEKAV
jgi:endonuclease/exonuclease/phosphatase family metal-dependent hydrolase